MSKLKLIFIHGNSGSSVNDEMWMKYLPQELIERYQGQIEVIAEDFPDRNAMNEQLSIPFLESKGADENTILIGHSSGALTAKRYAETHKVLGLVLVADCDKDLIDHSKSPESYLIEKLKLSPEKAKEISEHEESSGLYSRKFDTKAIQENTKFTAVFASQNDPFLPYQFQKTNIINNLNNLFLSFINKGHFGKMHGITVLKPLEDLLDYVINNPENLEDNVSHLGVHILKLDQVDRGTNELSVSDCIIPGLFSRDLVDIFEANNNDDVFFDEFRNEFKLDSEKLVINLVNYIKEHPGVITDLASHFMSLGLEGVWAQKYAVRAIMARTIDRILEHDQDSNVFSISDTEIHFTYQQDLDYAANSDQIINNQATGSQSETVHDYMTETAAASNSSNVLNSIPTTSNSILLVNDNILTDHNAEVVHYMGDGSSIGI